MEAQRRGNGQGRLATTLVLGSPLRAATPKDSGGTPTFRMSEPELGSLSASLTCSAAIEPRVLLVLRKCSLTTCPSTKINSPVVLDSPLSG